MNHNHSSVSHSRHWWRWIPLATATGFCGTALVIWFEEMIAFATEFIGVIFLHILTAIIYLFNVYVFKSAELKTDDLKK
jgi:hypothetical protein